MTHNNDHKQFANDFAFGLGQTVGCTFIDLVGDPYIGGLVQDKLSPQFKGQEMHARKAEFAGDAAAFGIFLGAQKYCPGLVKGIKSSTHKLLDPVYEKIGQNRLLEWAARHDVDPKSERFRAKLDEWKDFQIENFAKASVISGASVATNVAIQAALGNPRPLGVITLGKVAGATVTLGATMAIRALAPRTMQRIDKKISEGIVMPLISKTHERLGIEPGEITTADSLLEAGEKDFRTRLVSDKSAQASR